jgi:hypothetical protein
LAKADLVRSVAPGYDRDGLTGLWTRHRLRATISEAAFGSSWKDNSIVEVNLRRAQRRNTELTAWIEMRLSMSVLAATPEGLLIECVDPLWMKR